MFGYTTTLRSMTEGRGSMTMEFDHYWMQTAPFLGRPSQLKLVRAVARSLSSKKPGLGAERRVSYDTVPKNVTDDIIASRK